MFRRVLVANRGEIAVRVLRTLREMGIAGVALYSEVDRDAPHVRLADAAYPLRGTTAAETYLDQEQLLAVIRESGADAVHPGYGFLSENADFAAAVEQAGVKLVGPSPRAMREMGDKVAARRRMAAAGVPVIPGWEGDGGSVQEAAEAIGFPVLVKAAAGGGGKGMRRVDAPADLGAAVASCRREAAGAFGDDRVYLERYLSRPRHVEVQILGDSHGNVVHLFERECSIQRRHQKIVEETPSPALDEALRGEMTAAAVRAAQAIGYESAGTVEFILDEQRRFYFLEVNARLQVEHPITEALTGRDLVRAQLLVAAGEPLPFAQEAITRRGHSIECRVYAEDPVRDHLPSTGTLQVYREPRGPGVRVDSGVRQGCEVTILYDPMLAKIIVWAEDREAALAKMDRALADTVVLGVETNVPYLRRLLREPAFRAGDLHTHFLEEHPIPTAPPEPTPEVLAAAAFALSNRAAPTRTAARDPGDARPPSPWLTAGQWRLA